MTEIINIQSAIKWNLYDEDGKPVANFVPEVLGRIELQTSSGVENYLRLKLYFEDDESEEIRLQLSDINKIDWFEKDWRCLINPSYPKARAYLKNLICARLNEVPAEIKYRINKLGINSINGKIVFNAGDRILFRSPSQDNMKNIELGELPLRLDIDPELTMDETFEGMRELIRLSPEIGRVLVAYAVSGIIRGAFEESGSISRIVLAIVGVSGMLKSHFVPHLVQLYNRSDGIKATTRFNSTLSFMEDTICKYRDCTVIIDDLHTAWSGEIKRKNEIAFEELIRRFGDNMGRGHKEGKESKQNVFECNAVFIGEYVVGKESTIPRFLEVRLTKRPDGKVFDWYQREKPLLVSTFYYYFIQWYVERFSDICSEISERLTAFRREYVDSEIHGRLLDAYFSMRTSYMFFLEFYKGSGFISSEEAKVEYHDFDDQIFKLVVAQQAKFRSRPEKTDYLQLIRELYKNGRIRIAKNDKAYNPEKHDALIHYKCLCLRRETLDRLLCEVHPNVNIKGVIDFLMNMNALKCDKYTGKFIIKINSKNEYVKGKCFYGIYLSMLE